MDAFTLTDHRNEVEEDVVTGPTFRRSTAVQPPLTTRVGLGRVASSHGVGSP
jgi:hypothetical protein